MILIVQQKGFEMMNKILSVLICVLMIVALFAGCAGVMRPPFSVHPWPIVVGSIEEYHNFMVTSIAYTTPIIGQPRRTVTAYGWDFGDMERYYMPSWWPEGFELRGIMFSSGSVSFSFETEGAKHDQWNDGLLINNITFEWHVGFPDGEGLLNNEMRALNLQYAVGVSGLHFHDFGTGTNRNVNLVRSFHWLQDGYMFRLNVPLRIIEAHGHQNDGFGISSAGDSIADLVMGSALAVELVDGEYYVEPTGIEISESEADIAVGETLALTANVSPDNATIDAVIWSSSDHDVAIVSQGGVVTRVGEGAATITARTLANNLTAAFELGAHSGA